MANLSDRILNEETDPLLTPGGKDFKISIHGFMAALGELKRGQVTKAQVVAAFDLDASAETDLDALIAKVQGLPNNQARENFRMELHDVLLLAEGDLAYTTRAALRTRLGV